MYVGKTQEPIGHTDKDETFNYISDSKQCRVINEKWSTRTFQYGTVKGGSIDGIKNAGKQLIPWGDVGEKLYKLIKSL